MEKQILSLVSIIVPVYNVEKYIVKCLTSLVNQSYQHIEIILVNDGSTDNSGILCQRFVDDDVRISLVHQENQGLSAARNTGLDVCTGAYVMFVDSDDWISEKMIEILYSDMQRHNLMLSMCDFQKVSCEKSIVISSDFSNSTIVIPKQEAIKRMLLGEWWSACTKLYHKSIFNTLRFPVGRNNEDYAIMIYVFEQCEFISFNATKLYYYLTRPNSITTSKLNDRSFDEIENGLQIFNHVKVQHPQFQMEAEFNLGTSLIKLISAIYQDNSNEYFNKLPEFKALLNEHYKSLIKSSIMPIQQKIFLFIIFHFNGGFNLFFLKIYDKYKGLSTTIV